MVCLKSFEHRQRCTKGAQSGLRLFFIKQNFYKTKFNFYRHYTIAISNIYYTVSISLKIGIEIFSQNELINFIKVIAVLSCMEWYKNNHL